MRVVVFGATGGTGRAVIAKALAAGHMVTAFARNADRIAAADGLTVIEGDAMVASDVAPALAGQDAVVITLGNSQNAFALRLGARRTTPRDICEVGTRTILAALPQGTKVPIIVVGAFGTGDTRKALPVMFKVFYWLFLSEQMADKEKQILVLKTANTPTMLVQPLALTDTPGTGTWTTSRNGTFGKSEVSRNDLAAFIVSELTGGDHPSGTVTFSG